MVGKALISGYQKRGEKTLSPEEQRLLAKNISLDKTQGKKLERSMDRNIRNKIKMQLEQKQSVKVKVTKEEKDVKPSKTVGIMKKKLGEILNR